MLAIGADHRGYNLKEELKKFLDEMDIQYIDCGTYSNETVHYPEMAKKVAQRIQEGNAEGGILICGSGGGMTIVANKFKGIRAASITGEEDARFAKADDNINVLTIGADCLATDEAIRIMRTWIATTFKGGRYQERIDMINEIEKENMK